MAEQRQRTKSEVKRLFTNLRNKPITDEMISILIDLLWRDKTTLRTAGFEYPDPGVAVISFDSPTRIFSIEPFEPEIENYVPRYGFYSFSGSASFHRIFDLLTIEIPDEEGLYLIYFDTEDSPGQSQVLTIQKNPDTDQIQNIILNKVSIASIYWDAVAGEALYFGNEKHGSEWNPQIQWYLHSVFGARRSSGLQFENLNINGNGSNNSHAQFSITAGEILHDDFSLAIPSVDNTIPILYFLDGLPRFLLNTGFAAYNADRIVYNSNSATLTEADNGNFVIYHYFATNEIGNYSRKIISVMGTSQYTSLVAAYVGNQGELNEIQKYMPMQGRHYIDSAIFQTSDNYTNDIKSRIVGFVSSLWPDTNEYFTEMPQGDIDGVNTLFETSKPYAAGSIIVLYNGLKEYQFSEINETTIQLDDPPKNTGFTDIVECIYKLK